MEKKEVWGISIYYEEYSPTNRDWKNFNANYRIQKGIPSRKFISTPEIRETLTELEKQNKLSKRILILGSISMRITPKEGKAQIMFYNPIRGFKETLKGKGIAAYLELLALQELKRRHPKIKISQGTLLRERREQLEKRKTTLKKQFLETEIKRIQKKLRKDMKKQGKRIKRFREKAKPKA